METSVKSNIFSVYLLKQGFNNTNSLSEDHNLQQLDARNLPKDAILYI